jgi:hypothetical protein
VAPIIVDLITIYDDDSEDIDIILAIVNEFVTEIPKNQLPQGPHPMDAVTGLNTTENAITPLGQGSQSQAEGGNGQENKKDDYNIGYSTS